MKATRFVLVVSACAWLSSAASVANAGFVANHFTCHKVKDDLAKGTATKNLDENTPSGMVSNTGCVVKLPAKLACIPTFKDLSGPPGVSIQSNPVLCYAVKCPKQDFGPWAVTDQFGSHNLTPKGPKMLCAPACEDTGGSCILNSTCCSGTCTLGTCM
jgi:hypothetical protein